MPTIKHSLPGIGKTEIQLYSPALELYQKLRGAREIERQNQLRHLGVLSHAHPGTRLARWDYTVAMLHYASRISKLVGGNSFTLNGIEFSSSVAAVQTLSLAWNVGHLPGTFAVEKGVHTFLRSLDSTQPLRKLNIQHSQDPTVQRFCAEANRFLVDEDYLGMCRVLAVAKLLSLASNSDDLAFQIAMNFYWPIVADIETVPSARWERLRRVFRVVRHLAYLTLDCPFTGLQWLPAIPALVDQLSARSGGNFESFVSEASEILSPVERATSAAIYHSDEARVETARMARAVAARLESLRDPAREISHWLTCGLLRRLRLDRTRQIALQHVGSIRLRSHFHPDVKPLDLENGLRSAGYAYALVSRYVAWNSDALLEPNETIIDAFSEEDVTGSRIGRLISFLIERFDSFSRYDDLDLELLFRRDLRASYVHLLDRAIARLFPNTMLRLEPWNLGALGVRALRGQSPSDTGVLASDRTLNDSMTRRVLRRPRAASVPVAWQHQISELEGLRVLRTRLRKSWAGKIPRRRWLLVLASVRLARENNDLVEFDGGLLEISARTGNLIWWGVETKRGRRNPERSLTRRLTTLRINAEVFRISRRHAVAKIRIP